jgi:hypothetical protein
MSEANFLTSFSDVRSTIVPGIAAVTAMAPFPVMASCIFSMERIRAITSISAFADMLSAGREVIGQIQMPVWACWEGRVILSAEERTFAVAAAHIHCRNSHLGYKQPHNLLLRMRLRNIDYWQQSAYLSKTDCR